MFEYNSAMRDTCNITVRIFISSLTKPQLYHINEMTIAYTMGRSSHSWRLTATRFNRNTRILDIVYYYTQLDLVYF